MYSPPVTYSHAPPPPPPKLYTNDIREHSRKHKANKEEDIYLKTEAELAGKDFSGPFYYHYKKKNGSRNLGKPDLHKNTV